MDVTNIFPLIIPSNYYSKGAWELPHQELPNKNFLLTWTIFNSTGAMSYITKTDYEELTLNNAGWQRQAFENLRQSLSDNENFFTHQLPRENKKGIKFLAFIHSDGIGSSRVLLNFELEAAFPEGYYIAIPDRNCGIVIPKALSEKELTEVKKLIKDMYRNATIPMADELFRQENFSLPSEWLTPIDNDFSNAMISEIEKVLI